MSKRCLLDILCNINVIWDGRFFMASLQSMHRRDRETDYVHRKEITIDSVRKSGYVTTDEAKTRRETYQLFRTNNDCIIKACKSS